MVALTWRELDFDGVIIAGLVAGYVMALAGLWSARMPGMVAVDVADFGRRYLISDRPSAWFAGMLSHLVNSVILVFVWASVVLPNVHLPRVLTSLLWGLFLSLFLAGTLVAPLSGLGFLGNKTKTYKFALTNVVLHLIWGLLVGIIYVPR